MITVANLEYEYSKTRKKAIKGLNFEIQRGEIFGFLGPSGAGKTTAQRIIIGLLRGYTGSVYIMDRERKKWSKDFFEHIGVAFDFPNLYPKLTAAENLSLIGSYYKNGIKDINQVLDRVGLLPDRDKKVESFSKGMKMRLNFVRSIMHDPNVLFFDEPTSGLDPVNAKIVKDIILELKACGKTIFLTTHNMTVADQLCDRVAFIVDGKIPVIDSPAELKVKHGRKVVKIEYYDSSNEYSDEFAMETIGSDSQFLEIIRHKQLKTIHSQEATLEDIFINLTGKTLS